ncbi:MAG: 4Fe-4S binding protein [Anaerolineales bacterium]|nr:4Fe-4S binding protein [Anaerolineales bacterium]
MLRTSLRSKSRLRIDSPKRVAVDYGLCCSCGACVAVCPTEALFLNDMHLEVGEVCTGCGLCTKVCPVHALSIGQENRP